MLSEEVEAGQLRWLKPADKGDGEVASAAVQMAAPSSAAAGRATACWEQPQPRVPPPPLPALDEHVVGRRVSVQWCGDDGEPWYEGVIVSYSSGSGRHTIRYDDGDKKRHVLSEEVEAGQLRWLEM